MSGAGGSVPAAQGTHRSIAVQVVDLRDEPVTLADGKWSPHLRRNPSRLRGVVLHQWATPVGTEGRLRRRLGGETPALARRALAAPYNVSAGVGLHGGAPVVSVAHPAERYTHASDAACRDFVSLGVMGRFPYVDARHAAARHTVVTAELEAAVHAGLEACVAMLPKDGGPFLLITHRQAVNEASDHFACPGEAVIRMALTSRVVRDGILIPDADLVLVKGVGRGWPAEWRRHLGEDITPRGGQAPAPVAPITATPVDFDAGDDAPLVARRDDAERVLFALPALPEPPKTGEV